MSSQTLAAMDVAARLPKLRACISDAGLSALVVSHLPNIRYLTGFTGSAALLLVTADSLLFITDGRYRDQSAEQLDGAGVDGDIQITGDGHAGLMSGAVTKGWRVGLESDHVSWSQQRRWSTDWFAHAELVAAEPLVEQLRLVKDQGEIDRIARAATVADEALASVRHRLAERPTERELALELDFTMRRMGAEDVSFETIVAAGPNGAKPHARPGERQISEGDLLVMDFGALVEGYHSDMTRSFAIGEVDQVRQRMLDVVTESQAAGVAAVAAGVNASDVDKACRTVIDDAGWGEAFLHSTGHGVGLDIHEPPRVSASADATLAADLVITVEPGVYLPDIGGVRVEDLLVVTSEGSINLSNSPKATTVS